MKNKKIMILGASILQLPAINKAKEMGLDVIAVDMNPDAVGFKIEGIEKAIISTIDTPAILECAKNHRIDGIMTLASDMPMQSVAVVSESLGLVGVSRETALLATNKAYMRDALKAHNVPVPLFYRVYDIAAFKKAVADVRSKGYRCIVKPADNSGSRGVDLLSDESDLDSAYAYSKQFSRSGELVVEEYMEGPEVSVETLASDGCIRAIQVTDKITTGAPYFVEMGHTQPSRIDKAIQDEIINVAIAANNAIGISNGPSHTEIKVTKDGPKIVELGARLGGDCITTHLVPLSTGVDLVENCIRIALGEKPDLTPKWSRGAAIRYLKTEQGIVKSIVGTEIAEGMPGIAQVSIVHGQGEKVGEIKSSTDRVGFVIASGSDAVEAERRCEDAIKCINIDLE